MIIKLRIPKVDGLILGTAIKTKKTSPLFLESSFFSPIRRVDGFNFDDRRWTVRELETEMESDDEKRLTPSTPCRNVNTWDGADLHL